MLIREILLSLEISENTAQAADPEKYCSRKYCSGGKNTALADLPYKKFPGREAPRKNCAYCSLQKSQKYCSAYNFKGILLK